MSSQVHEAEVRGHELHLAKAHNTRLGQQLTAQRDSVALEVESCTKISAEAQEEHAALTAQGANLGASIQACKVDNAELDRGNAAAALAILRVLGDITARSAQLLSSGQHCGHHNQKQKIRRAVNMELENVRFRKENFALRSELRKLQRLELEQAHY